MRILLVVHGFPPAARGGTELYTHALSTALASTGADEVFVLTRHTDPSKPELEVRREQAAGVQVYSINNNFRACTSFEESYTNPSLLRAASDVISAIAPDVAHVQHLTCLSTEIPAELARRGVPVVMTLNDYWMICHRGQLFDLDWQRCAGPYDDGCDQCVPAASLSGPATFRAAQVFKTSNVQRIPGLTRVLSAVTGATKSAAAMRAASAARLATMRRAATHVRLFLAPSQTIAEQFSRFGIGRDRLVRCSQGIHLRRFTRSPRDTSGVLRLGFAGALIPSKAPHVLLEAAALLPRDSVNVEVRGQAVPYHGDNRYSGALDPLLRLPFVASTGAVDHAEMPRWLSGLDALVVPSVWIENAPFVIREAFAAGAPVVASNLGGMAEMVTHDVNGLLFAPGASDALAAQLRRLQIEPDLLARLSAAVPVPMSIDEDAATLREGYERLRTGRPLPFERVT